MDYTLINNKIKLRNNQSGIAYKAWYAIACFLVLMVLPLKEWSPIYRWYAVSAFSLFFLMASIIVLILFSNRSKKLQSLVSQQNLLAEWTLSESQKELYSNHLFEQEKGRNLVILFSIGIIAAIVFGVFILVIDEGRLIMFLVYLGLMLLLSLFAFIMPLYYRYKNNNNDGIVLVGAKYAYINGFFHNWDYPLSGLKKVKAIKFPFHGIQLAYYYTDRTLHHGEELIIPVNEDIDLADLIARMKILNDS